MAANANLICRFRGCLVGAVAGDCLGAPYEVHGVPEKNTFEGLTRFFKQIGTEITEKDYLSYTDDTAMARSIAQSLIDNKGKFNSKDLAKKFGAEYHQQPGRGYGANIISVLKAFGREVPEDPFELARQQFGGAGSFGNGGAMRIAPAGLCPEGDFDIMIETARQSAKVTHSNFLGYTGAVLQCCAVHLALHADPTNFDTDAYIDRLLTVILKEEEAESSAGAGTKEQQDSSPPPSKMSRRDSESATANTEYSRRLKLLKPLLEEDADIKKVAAELGNDIAAHQSVVAAIYSFLRCQRPVEGICSTFNPLERTVLYAISLDGDTDTIGSMAGAIAGAFYGMQVSSAWITVCEGTEYALKQANGLYDIYYGPYTWRGQHSIKEDV